MKWKEYIDRFIEFMKLERGASVHTLRAYRKDLEEFFGFISKDPGDIDLTDVRGFVAYRLRLGRKPSAVGRQLATLRSFFRFLHREAIVEQNPARAVPNPAKDRSLPVFLSIEEVFSLVEAPDGVGFLYARDRAILELLYGCGLRVAELVRLRVDDVNLREGFLKVLGKRKKERIVPIGQKASEAVQSYMIERALKDVQTDVLFLNRYLKPLSDRSVREIVKKYAYRTGVTAKVTPHTLRHTFATHLIQSGAELRDIQELLGHSTLAATQIYTHLDLRHLIDVYDRAHPLSKQSPSEER